MRILGATLTLLALVACGNPDTKPRYNWDLYEGSLLQQCRKPERGSDYADALRRTLEDAEAKGCIPPGLCAEYGYLLLAGGNTREALTWLEKEKALFPESTLFVDRLVARIRASEKRS